MTPIAALAAFEDEPGLDLQAAIQQLITLGEKDPLTIARKLERRHGADWLLSQLANYREEIVAEIARHRLGNERRAATLATVARGGSKREVQLASVFIPAAGTSPLAVADRRERQRTNAVGQAA